MRWAIRHKSGRTLFVTSDEFIANNRREMGWIVEEVKMTSREQFNEWFYEYTGCNPKDSRYVNMVEMYWMAWHSSRLAIEIESPDFIDSRAALNKGYTVDYSNGFGDAMDAYELAIEQAGLEVKK
nr:MAG TPA: helix-turn-helix domain protein [Caudoviricetes sp.]